MLIFVCHLPVRVRPRRRSNVQMFELVERGVFFEVICSVQRVARRSVEGFYAVRFTLFTFSMF